MKVVPGYSNTSLELNQDSIDKKDYLQPASSPHQRVHVFQKNSISSFIGYHFNKIFNRSNWVEVTLRNPDKQYKEFKVLIDRNANDAIKSIFVKEFPFSSGKGTGPLYKG